MKNSLFKRAIAVACAVPVALTQCLTVANAVYVDYSVPVAVKNAESESFTLDKGEATSLLYIAPEADYARDEYTFTKESNWNSRIDTALDKVAGKTGALDLTKIYEKAIEKSGEYREVTASLIDKIEYVNYSVSDNGEIIIEGKLNNITPTFTAGGAKTIGGALRELAAEYGVEDLYEPEDFFKDTVIGCTFKAVFDGSSLADDTQVTGTFELTDTASGKVYKGTGAIDWALQGFDALKETAKETCDKYSDVINTADAYKEIDDSVSFYVDKLETAWAKAEETYKTTSSVEAATGKEFAQIVNEAVYEKTGKNPFAIMWKNSELICTVYEDILAQVNAIADPYTFDITIDECSALALSLYDIKTSTTNGYATFEAKFEDKEADEAAAYIENEYNVEVVEVYKQILVVADGTKVAHELGGEGTADMKIERVVIAKEKESTTTSTTTTDTTTTTSVTTTDASNVPTTAAPTTAGGSDVPTTAAPTTDAPDVPTTAAPTTGGGSDVPTTAAPTTDAPDVPTTAAPTTDAPDVPTTAAPTTGGGSDVPTTAAPTTDAPDVPTTAAPTTAGGSDVPTTAAPTTDAPDVPTTAAPTTAGGSDVPTTPGSSTTTTRTETKYVVNFATETVVGFYLDIDPEFNIDQVKSLGYSVDYSVLSYGEDGSLVSQEIIIKGEKVDITKSIEFKDVPADVFKLINTNNVNQFAAQIQIYATEDITAADGTVVAKAGDALKYVDGSPVSATAYIGVKGDASLDMKADSIDASLVLSWYAKVSTGGVPGEIQFSNNDLLVQNNPVLDDFAAFLADVDNENDSANYVTLKTARTIDSKDSSNILAYYAQLMTGAKAGRDTWNNVLGEYGKYN